jgi:hypothetical protein
MQNRTYQKFLALGFDTVLIGKFEAAQLTVAGLQGLGKGALLQMNFTGEEYAIIAAKVKRQPIAKATLESIITRTGEVCCYCAEGNTVQPYQIHHITEYHLTQDNSEDNLLLVCPTHHVAIHTNGLPTDEQKQKRVAWENIWPIARAYQAQGLTFPFRAIEYITYEQTPNIAEVFEFTAPCPATCLAVLDEGNKDSACRILAEENILIITGASGSGKTTFAKGVAGSLKGFAVYGYIVPQTGTNAVNEVLMFCSLATKDFALIIDNANTYLAEGQIEAILKAASPNKKLIVIQTRGVQATDNNVEEHFVDGTFHISWSHLKHGIKAKLLEYEHDVISYLESQQFHSGYDFGIGEGKMNQPLTHLIDNYSKDVETAYQFFYLFSSGIERIDKLQVELASHDHLDVILLFIAINQIGRVENGSTLAEIAEQYKVLSLFKSKPAPEQEWVKEQLQIIQKKRLIRTERGRYNTVHREFARRYIEHCYFKRKNVTDELLIPIFNDPNRIDEITPLWSWLNSTSTRDFVRAWARKQTLDDWRALVRSACNKGLAVISLLADEMFHLTFNLQTGISGAFDGMADDIALLINQDKQLHVYYLRRLIAALHRLQPEIVAEIMKLTDKTVISTLIKNAPPNYFDDVGRLFHDIREHYSEWVDEMRIFFTNEDFEEIIGRIELGGIDELQAVVEFQREYLHDISKSQYFKYTAKFAALLKDCPLKDIRYGGTISSGFFELNLFPDEIHRIIDSLNAAQLSVELSDCLPRDWDNLGMLGIMSHNITTDTFERIVENIDVDQLKKSVGKYYKVYHYELRVFLYLLSYGLSEKRKAIAEALKPFVREIVQSNGLQDNNDVFKAYFALDENSGVTLAAELQVPQPEKFEKINFSDWDILREHLKEIEKTEADYPMSRLRSL